MATLSRTSLWWALLLLSLAASEVQGQWSIMASNLLPATQYSNSSMDYCDGIIWAGSAMSLYCSRDTGKSWQTVNLPFFDFIRDISFYNEKIGVIAGNSGLYRTLDGGTTWNDISPARGAFWQVAFNGSPSVIHALETEPAILFTSTDEGQSWHGTYLTGQAGNCIATASDNTLYVFSNNASSSNLLGWINSSTDFGANWSGNGGFNDGDCYSLTVDSCDSKRLYLANENYASTGDGNSKILLSTNGGSTWQTTFSHAREYLSGTIINADAVIYAGTVNTGPSNGILRSTDRGLTWLNIQGPSVGADTRSLTALNNNTIFALDVSGNIWATFNSGGNPIPASSLDFSFSATPSTLFSSDTVLCNTLSRAIALNIKGCPLPHISSLSLIGNDAESYQAQLLSSDSIVVTLSGLGAPARSQSSQLVISLDNQYNDTILLTGYVNTPAVPVSIVTQDVSTDTLGAIVRVPITIHGLTKPEDVNLVLHYDGSVDHLGSYSPTGVRLDIPGDSSYGRSVLHITGAVPDSVAGYAEFNVFSDSGENAHATFDSLNVITAASPCEYSRPRLAVSTIFPPKGCNIPILSKLIHLGEPPTFGVYPNPATDNIWITSSDDVGNATITVYDMLGIERTAIHANFKEGVPQELSLPDEDGVFYIAVKTPLGISYLQVLRER